jgi:hypothetical protein
MADCALEQGHAEEALTNYADSLRQLRGVDLTNAVMQMAGIAGSLALLGRDEEAAYIVGAVDAAAERVGIGGSLLDAGPMLAPMAASRARLGPAEWDRAHAAGRALDAERAIDLALEMAATGVPARLGPRAPEERRRRARPAVARAAPGPPGPPRPDPRCAAPAPADRDHPRLRPAC